MDALKCPSCGSVTLDKISEGYRCPYCGTVLMRDTSKAASLHNENRVSEMLTKADIFWRHDKKQQARAIYRQILELDANCAEAIARLRER